MICQPEISTCQGSARASTHFFGRFSSCSRAMPAIVLFACLAVPSTVFADEKYTLKEIQSRLSKWESGFATLRVKWRQWHRHDVMTYYPEASANSTIHDTAYYTDYEFCWTDYGGLSIESANYKNNLLQNRSIHGLNSKQAFDSVGIVEDGQFVGWDHIMLLGKHAERPQATNISYVALTGLWNSSGRWFSADLCNNTSSVRLVGYQAVQGVDCAVLEMNVVADNAEVQHKYWLDAKVGFLPRKYEMTGRSDGVMWKTRYIVNEFQRTGGTYFPLHGFYHPGGDVPEPGFEWLITSVQYNANLPPSQFLPRFDVGTRVTDYPRGRVYRATAKGLVPPVIAPSPNYTSGDSDEFPDISPATVSVQRKSSALWRGAGIFLVVFLMVLVFTKYIRRHYAP